MREAESARQRLVEGQGRVGAAPLWSPRVFLAEDEPEMREVIALCLRQAGYEVVAVESGGPLMDLLASSMTSDGLFDVDVIITDIRMPGTTGMRALAMLREYDRITPVVMITAFGGEATHAEAQRLGATVVVDKPFDLDEFCGVIQRLAPRGARMPMECAD